MNSRGDGPVKSNGSPTKTPTKDRRRDQDIDSESRDRDADGGGGWKSLWSLDYEIESPRK